MIPKIIHYCWLSDDDVPNDLQECMKTWKEKLPDYKFMKWDFSRFDKESSVWVSEAFDNKKYAFACDYIRLYALYNYGGIYMDMDIEVLRKFDDLLNSQYMIAKERENLNWIEAGCFGAEKGSDFISKCLEYYEGRHFIDDNGIMNDTPLPQIMSKIYKDNGFNFDLGDWQMFTCKSYYTGKIVPGRNSYAIHHFAGSWKDETEKRIHQNTVKIRNSIKVIGPSVAFIYEKSNKSIMALKSGGVKEMVMRVNRFLHRG